MCLCVWVGEHHCAAGRRVMAPGVGDGGTRRNDFKDGEEIDNDDGEEIDNDDDEEEDR